MASCLCLSFILVLYGIGTVTAQLCADLDTHACALFASSQADFCQNNPVAESSCKRFCGKCPLTCYDCPQHSVLDPDTCNTTRICSNDQTCILNTLMASDGHTEHIMTCGDKRICDGFGLGFVVGRRSLGTKRKGSRNLSLKCCHSDLCNYPGHTTHAPNTLVTSLTTPLPFISCRSDIVFVVEQSSRIGPVFFQEIIKFLSSLSSHLDIGSHGDQVSLLVYNNQPYIQWYLNEYTSTSALLNAFSYVPYHNGTSRTDLALQFVRENILQYKNGDRLDAPDIVVVITEGRSNVHSNTVLEASKLHTAGVKVISLGVGHVIDNEILQIASDSRNLALKVTTYSRLVDALPLILERLC